MPMLISYFENEFEFKKLVIMGLLFCVPRRLRY